MEYLYRNTIRDTECISPWRTYKWCVCS